MTNDATEPQPKMPKHTPAIFEVLKQCADDMTAISYGDLAERVGVHPRNVNRPLGYIRDVVCRPHGRPWLSVLAVNAKSRWPGNAWTNDDSVQILKEEDGKRIWRGMVLQVYAYDWSGVEIEGG